jgi:hypothetical protein
MPVAAQKFPHGCAAADLGQFQPDRRRLHGIACAQVAVALADGHERILHAGFGAGFVTWRCMTAPFFGLKAKFFGLKAKSMIVSTVA